MWVSPNPLTFTIYFGGPEGQLWWIFSLRSLVSGINTAYVKQFPFAWMCLGNIFKILVFYLD